MRWVFEHFQLIIVIAGAIAYFLNQRSREKAGQPADYDEDGIPDNKPNATNFDRSTMDAEESERTRELQEELRRKREQRGGAPVAPPRLPQAPRPLAPQGNDPLSELMRELSQKLSPEAAPVLVPVQEAPLTQVAEEDLILERQKALDAQYKALRVERQNTRREARELSDANRPRISSERAAPEGSWLAGLRDPLAIRRAIVMNEILGKPVALKK